MEVMNKDWEVVYYYKISYRKRQSKSSKRFYKNKQYDYIKIRYRGYKIVDSLHEENNIYGFKITKTQYRKILQSANVCLN